ncbi:MAG TPA: hypothetical protein VFQ61_04480 [Polyangiaceae bacterium]|nr:hypothetical protein [Polyangiaceae bacterium]
MTRTNRTALMLAWTTRLSLVLAMCSALSACADGDPPYDDVTGKLDADLLSNRGFYADLASGTPPENALEYEPDYALWSDGAVKRRWLILPPGAQIDTSDMDHWQFPVGTVAVKEFSLEGKRLETRVIERVGDSGVQKEDYRLGTFVWRDDQSDAVLTSDGVPNVNGTTHDVPAQKFCMHCHKGEPGTVLGFSAMQTSKSGWLSRLVELGAVTNAPDHSFAIPGDATQSKALGILHANCGHCHTDKGMAPKMRLRLRTEEAELPFEETELYQTTVGQRISRDWLAPPPEYTIRIAPGHPESSAVLYRMEQRGDDDELVPEQMPPIATNKVDEEAVAVIRDWIAALPEL